MALQSFYHSYMDRRSYVQDLGAAKLGTDPSNHFYVYFHSR